MTTRVMHEWGVDVERGPDWLFVRLHPPAVAGVPSMALAEDIWSTIQQHMVHRLVLEMDDVPLLSSHLLGQLLMLHKRIHEAGGIMRLCGLNEQNEQVLRIARLDSRLPHYGHREEAVRGYPTQPR